MQNDERLLRYIAAGGKLDAPENASPRYRGELMRLMAVFVDSEMAGASGFADCINMACGLKERQIAARIVWEKLGHAEQVLKIMEMFGANTRRYATVHPWEKRLARDADLGTQRVDGDMRLNVFHYPITGWVDAVTMNCLMGRATVIQLDDLTRCSYQPMADVMKGILATETRHAELGEAGLRAALAAGADRAEAQSSVDYWFPRVAATFGRITSGHFAAYRKYGLREHSNEELLRRWQNAITATLDRLGLSLPRAEQGAEDA